MTLRVLMGTAYFDNHRGGIEIVAGTLARELRGLGANVRWLASDAMPSPAVNTGSGVPCPIAAWNITERRLGVPMPLPGPAGLATICREVKACDVVHLHDSLYLTNVAAMLAAGRYGKPVVLTQHIAAVPYSSALLRGVMRAANALIARPMLKTADQVVFISKSVLGHFAEVPYKAQPRLIFNGVDAEIFHLPSPGFNRNAARAVFGLPAEARVVLFVGRFVEKKGLHLIERLARKRSDLVFALAGWGPIDPRRWGLTNVHILTGLQGPSLVPLYQASDVLALPSIGEGLPLVIQEALACGLPVICGTETTTADPGAAALIEGVDVEGADPEVLVRGIANRIDSVLAANSGTQGAAAAEARHAYVSAHYSWSEAAKAYLSIMTRLVERQSSVTMGEVSSLPQDAQRP